MTRAAELWEQARRRANFACEYCGVTETDVGGLLTVDHFQPQARGGADALGNLLYCCHRCNLYKADYWPTQPTDPVLWNPREESVGTHLLFLTDVRRWVVSSRAYGAAAWAEIKAPVLALLRPGRAAGPGRTARK